MIFAQNIILTQNIILAQNFILTQSRRGRRVFRRVMVVGIGVLGVSDRSGRLSKLTLRISSLRNSASLRENKILREK